MIFSGVLVLSAGLFLPGQSARDELGMLQGEWVLLETADAKRTDPGADSICMVISDQTMTMLFSGVETNRGSLVLGFTRGVRTIDMKFANGRVVLGVYELIGDMLTFCVSEPRNARPGSLAPRGSQWVEKWKRIPPGHE
jgi:uncharacterized protein (TIGR03067 family)